MKPRIKQGGFLSFELGLFIAIIGAISLVGIYIHKSGNEANELLNQSISKSNDNNFDSSPTRIVAIGDVACKPDDPNFSGNDPKKCQSAKTHALAERIKPDAVLALGDLQYDKGELVNFQTSYDKDWGKIIAKTYPVPGNHEYATDGAEGFYSYFSDQKLLERDKGYYEFNLGGWKLIGLNSNCKDVSCDIGSAQYNWLKDILSANKQTCTLAFWHHPRFTSGRYFADESRDRTKDFWQELVTNKADLVLVGHDHLYERFDLQDASGQADPQGIRQFTVGTGGKSLYSQKVKHPNSQKIIDDKFGVLELELYSKAYKWKFIDIDGAVLDSGRQSCTK